MFYEEKVTSFAELAKRLRILDQDAGIRLLGRLGSKGVLVFVTKFGPKYTLMTYATKKDGTPGKRLQTLELEGIKEAERSLKGYIRGRLHAWVY